MPTKLFGVSSGNGNDGVSQMFPDFYVHTDDPWELAKRAALAEFKPGSGQAWAERHMEIDGEAEFTIYAIFDCPPCEETADGEYPDLPEGQEWDGGNGAWMIVEVFPVDDEPRDGVPVYESLADAF